MGVLLKYFYSSTKVLQKYTIFEFSKQVAFSDLLNYFCKIDCAACDHRRNELCLTREQAGGAQEVVWDSWDT